MSAMLALCAGAATAQPKPIENTNGSFAGTIDGHSIELPVLCMELGEFTDISSHDQPIHNNASIGGVEPAVGLLLVHNGFQVSAFVGGERYLIRRPGDKIEAFPFRLAGEVRASKIGKIDVDFTVTCPAS